MHINENVNKKYTYACQIIWTKHKKIPTPKQMHRTNTQQHPNPQQIPHNPPNQTKTKPHHPNQPRKTNPTNHHQQIRHKHKNNTPNKTTPNPTNNTNQHQNHPNNIYRPHLSFNKITNHHHLNQILTKTFNPTTTKDILSLSWYLASKGNALSDSDSWLQYYQTPAIPL